jgi:uncharacterized protein (DUF58 family)
MQYPIISQGKLKFSVLASAAIAYLLHKQRDAVGICTYSDQIEIQTQIKSTSTHLNKMFIILENLLKEKPSEKKTSVAEVLHVIAEKNHKRSLIVIFSDMFENTNQLDEIFKALQHLKHNKHEVLLFHVTDHKTEYNFDFEDRPYEFIDLESGEKLKIQPSQIKDTYRTKISAFYHDLKLKCGQLKIDFVEADINNYFNEVLNAYLVKRARMK